MRIAANDVTAAHAASRRLLVTGAELITQRMEEAAAKYRNPLKRLYAAFGDDLMYCSVERASGSRAKWAAVVAAPAGKDDGISFGLILWQGGRLSSYEVGTASPHLLARLIQRTANSDRAGDVLPLFRRYAGAAWQFAFSVPPTCAGQIAVSGPEGVVLGHYAKGRLDLRTWLNPDTAADPALRALAERIRTAPSRIYVASFTQGHTA